MKGRQGLCGNPGPQGPSGLQGSKGDKGEKGDKGDKGDPGSGGSGSQGPKGDKGDTGQRGPKGDNRDKGDQGDQGPKGDKGDTGSQGPKGDKGDPGSTSIPTINQDADFRGCKITNLGTPIQDKDAATKKYVDDKPRGITKATADSLYLGKGVGELKGALHFLNASKITNLGNPQAPTDGANKRYVDSKLGQSGMTQHTADNRYLSRNGGGLKGNLNMRNNKVTSLADPVDPNNATNRSWVETHTVGNYLALDGGTMRGKVDMGHYRIINLPKAIENEDAASVAWVKENTVTSSWVDTRIDEKTPKGIYKLIAYVNGSPDSHVVSLLLTAKLARTSSWSLALRTILWMGTIFLTLTFVKRGVTA